MIFRYLIGAVLFLVGWQLWKYLLSPAPSARNPPTGPPPRGEAKKMVKDPSCGTYVPKETAHRMEIEGETQWFCSDECRSQFSHKLPNRH